LKIRVAEVTSRNFGTIKSPEGLSHKCKKL
jgi:hypothetical protein